MTVREDLDRVANRVANKAAEDGTALELSVDALKALTAYYTAITKPRKSEAEPDEDASTFANFEQSIRAAEGSPDVVKARTGRNGGRGN